MPHLAVTGVQRSKRPDTRPNSKQRMKGLRRDEKAKTVQDMRITRVQQEDRKEREIIPEFSPLVVKSTKSDDEKLLKALKKKLQAIDTLIQLQKSGARLDEQQETKVARLDSLMAEMSSVVIRMSEGTSATGAIEDEEVEEKPSTTTQDETVGKKSKKRKLQT